MHGLHSALLQSKVVRIGHPARLVDSVLRYSLDALISASDSAQIVQDVRKEIQTASVSIQFLPTTF